MFEDQTVLDHTALQDCRLHVTYKRDIPWFSPFEGSEHFTVEVAFSQLFPGCSSAARHQTTTSSANALPQHDTEHHSLSPEPPTLSQLQFVALLRSLSQA